MRGVVIVSASAAAASLREERLEEREPVSVRIVEDAKHLERGEGDREPAYEEAVPAVPQEHHRRGEREHVHPSHVTKRMVAELRPFGVEPQRGRCGDVEVGPEPSHEYAAGGGASNGQRAPHGVSPRGGVPVTGEVCQHSAADDPDHPARREAVAEQQEPDQRCHDHQG